MAEKVSVIIPLYGNPLLYAPLVVVSGQGGGDISLVRNELNVSSPVVINLFTETVLNTFGFFVVQVKVLANYGYNEFNTVL